MCICQLKITMLEYSWEYSLLFEGWKGQGQREDFNLE